MTNADRIRTLSNDELVDLLVWGSVFEDGLEVPTCDNGCEYCKSGCALDCPIERRERNVRKWLDEDKEAANDD